MEFQITNDFFNHFYAVFTNKDSIIQKQKQPLGYYAVQVLTMDRDIDHRFSNAADNFFDEFNVFLASRSPSSSAVAQAKLNKLWSVLSEYPVYDLLYPEGKRASQTLFTNLRCDPDAVDDMVTAGTERNRALQDWLKRLKELPRQLFQFKDNLELILDHIEKVRTPSDYATGYSRLLCATEDVFMQQDNEADLEIATRFRFYFPVELSYVPMYQGNSLTLAERMNFTTLDNFLYVDFFKGLASGNIPRRCQNCGKYFLAIGAYNTRYCNNIAPGETERTCRMVGAHRREKAKSQSQPILKEYARVYNRLKARKRNGKLTEAEWNKQVAEIQELKEKALRGEYSDAELRVMYDRI